MPGGMLGRLRNRREAVNALVYSVVVAAVRTRILTFDVIRIQVREAAQIRSYACHEERRKPVPFTFRLIFLGDLGTPPLTHLND